MNVSKYFRKNKKTTRKKIITKFIKRVYCYKKKVFENFYTITILVFNKFNRLRKIKRTIIRVITPFIVGSVISLWQLFNPYFNHNDMVNRNNEYQFLNKEKIERLISQSSNFDQQSFSSFHGSISDQNWQYDSNLISSNSKQVILNIRSGDLNWKFSAGKRARG